MINTLDNYVTVERPLTMRNLRVASRENRDTLQRYGHLRLRVTPDEAAALEAGASFPGQIGLPGFVRRTDYGPGGLSTATETEIGACECWRIEVAP